MNYEKLEYYLSKPRLERFLIATGNSKSKAIELYNLNLIVSQSFYPILNLFEISLRNIVYYQISKFFKNPDWIITEKNGFMSDTSLKPSKFFLKNSVIKAEKSIKQENISVGKIIAEQSFGFWTSLFDTHHYKLIGGCVIKSFPNKPRNTNRKLISSKLNKIRKFRNRIYHNEPICFNGSSIDFSNALFIKNEIYELLSWVDNDLKKYIYNFDDIDSKIKSNLF